MKRQVRRNRQARQDIIDIYRYLEPRSRDAAERVLDAIEATVKTLLDHPQFGRLWESAEPSLDGLRVCLVKTYRNYLIFYRPAADGIELFRVVHGARELERIVDEIDTEFDSEL